ncbi:BrnA antitoxin family protein [Lamprocystis purpurea]|nr:BrnA antitoxin family protein [Lamprocystis purpurea]
MAIRLGPEVLAAFRADGPGWQTRINAVLRQYVEQQRSAP